MELLVTLRRFEQLEKLINNCDGVIVGGLFSSGYNYSLDELKTINQLVKEEGLKFYLTIENFISEDQKQDLYSYFDFISKLDIDGIYFHDLGIYSIALSFNMENKLIYDGQTVMCNSLDVAYYMSKGIDGVVISRELTIEEITQIVRNNPNCCDMQIFGHLRMSYSARRFLKNYFKEINEDYDFYNKESLYLIEELRDYKMPIVEDKSGTKIYTDYIFEMYQELTDIKPFIKRGIIDTMFIKDNRIIDVLRDYKRISNDNASFLLEALNKNYPDNYSTGYLYEKTNITKDE